MITAWRITSRKHAEFAFSGKGAELVGGRWNSPGSRIVYTSSSISLAILEILVHLKSESVLSSYILIPVEFRDAYVEKLDPGELPDDWISHPASALTQTVGDEWARSQRSLVLQVPSVVVPIEPNYLINPSHTKFGQLKIGDPISFPLDERLSKLVKLN
jgi:RES domain-containing protein